MAGQRGRRCSEPGTLGAAPPPPPLPAPPPGAPPAGGTSANLKPRVGLLPPARPSPALLQLCPGPAGRLGLRPSPRVPHGGSRGLRGWVTGKIVLELGTCRGHPGRRMAALSLGGRGTAGEGAASLHHRPGCPPPAPAPLQARRAAGSAIPTQSGPWHVLGRDGMPGSQEQAGTWAGGRVPRT